jgi:hypothetical protein
MVSVTVCEREERLCWEIVRCVKEMQVGRTQVKVTDSELRGVQETASVACKEIDASDEELDETARTAAGQAEQMVVCVLPVLELQQQCETRGSGQRASVVVLEDLKMASAEALRSATVQQAEELEAQAEKPVIAYANVATLDNEVREQRRCEEHHKAKLDAGDGDLEALREEETSGEDLIGFYLSRAAQCEWRESEVQARCLPSQPEAKEEQAAHTDKTSIDNAIFLVQQGGRRSPLKCTQQCVPLDQRFGACLRELGARAPARKVDHHGSMWGATEIVRSAPRDQEHKVREQLDQSWADKRDMLAITTNEGSVTAQTAEGGERAKDEVSRGLQQELLPAVAVLPWPGEQTNGLQQELLPAMAVPPWPGEEIPGSPAIAEETQRKLNTAKTIDADDGLAQDGRSSKLRDQLADEIEMVDIVVGRNELIIGGDTRNDVHAEGKPVHLQGEWTAAYVKPVSDAEEEVLMVLTRSRLSVSSSPSNELATDRAMVGTLAPTDDPRVNKHECRQLCEETKVEQEQSQRGTEEPWDPAEQTEDQARAVGPQRSSDEGALVVRSGSKMPKYERGSEECDIQSMCRRRGANKATSITPGEVAIASLDGLSLMKEQRALVDEAPRCGVQRLLGQGGALATRQVALLAEQATRWPPPRFVAPRDWQRTEWPPPNGRRLVRQWNQVCERGPRAIPAREGKERRALATDQGRQVEVLRYESGSLGEKDMHSLPKADHPWTHVLPEEVIGRAASPTTPKEESSEVWHTYDRCYAYSFEEEPKCAQFPADSGIEPIATGGAVIPRLADLTQATRSKAFAGGTLGPRGAPAARRGAQLAGQATQWLLPRFVAPRHWQRTGRPPQDCHRLRRPWDQVIPRGPRPQSARAGNHDGFEFQEETLASTRARGTGTQKREHVVKKMSTTIDVNKARRQDDVKKQPAQRSSRCSQM